MEFPFENSSLEPFSITSSL
uniref:Uncharacterized protein n=1 Tax=Rhizophora mucronata TaxID=61149 RepID=A0A2P2R3B0_RHIMU